MKPKLVIWGAGGHAMAVADIIRLRDEYEIVGFLDDVNQKRHGTRFYGAPILGGREQLNIIKQKGVGYLILGFGDCDARLKLADLAIGTGFSVATAIHPMASIATDVAIGPGSIVKSMAVIEPGAIIKQQVIIGAHAYVAHECIIEDGVLISAGGKVGGKTIVGRAAWIGIGATVKDRVRIGERAQIGAGSVVLEDIPDNVVAFGVPSRVRWKRDLWTVRQMDKADDVNNN